MLLKISIPRIVMANRRYAGEQVFQPADKIPVRPRDCARLGDNEIVLKTRFDIATPLMRVRVCLAEFYFAKIIHSEVIVSVDQSRQYD